MTQDTGTILDKIIADKRIEVDMRKQMVTINQLKGYPAFRATVPSFSKYITYPTKTGIIAEYKRQSPSKGTINGHMTVHDVVPEYEKAGASAVSVLTDSKYFGGTIYDLLRACEMLTLPVLRKDFTIDEYQIYEAKALGASAILLIAAALTKEEIIEFTDTAHTIGLEVLLEIHDQEEIQKIYNKVDVVGINNRNLKTFKVNIEQSIRLANMLPKEMLKITESGISDPKVVRKMKQEGFQGFLIGECFMKEVDPGKAIVEFITEVKRKD